MADVTEEEKQKIRDRIQKLKESKFKQQTLPAWRPVPTAMSTLITFSIFSVIFIGMGAILFSKSNEIKEYGMQYDNQGDCTTVKNLDTDFKFGSKLPDNECYITFKVGEGGMGNKVFAYF